MWLTRGRDWGLAFVRDGEETDPLPFYEKAFGSLLDAREGTEHSALGTALRFPDPLGREDRSGRRIIHDVLVYPPDSERIHTLEEGIALVWPEIEADYARDYPLPRPTA